MSGPAAPAAPRPAGAEERVGEAPAGLGSREAARRLAIHGPNVLPPKARSGWLRQVLRQLVHP
ncbi:MAG: cation-transporting P-type ATPase, partial [Amnibacterium sp.]